ncbi:hypothetical protein M885DRAFT_203351 [Pelagophyceae sp. CCMP2097]|nr:hypothetical protein M885DRAFT_203351 [Pelagophyceae sp. CCMP2097]
MLYSALDGEAPCCLEFAAFLRNYDIARVNAAPAAKLAHVVERATELDAAIGAYVDALKREGPVHATEVARLERALPRLALAGASPAQVVDCFAELRPTALEAALRLLLDSAGSVHARSMPTIDVETLLGRADSGAAASLDGCIAHLAVALAGDHVLVGKGFDVSSALNVSSAPRDGAAADDAAENDAAVISALLGAGLSYSYSPAGLLLAQFASRRSVLRLRDSFFPAPSDHLRRSLRKRRSELARQLRARGECLSLRFDTVPFDDVLKLLRQNKDSCWVGGRCAAAWSALRLVGAFCVAELWQNDTLVACDFVHSSGRRCYVATRYAARAGAPKSPGFLLALLLACALGRRGFEVLDFGGVDASPELEYKLQLCDALDRALHLDCVRREDRAAPPPSLPPVGVLIHRIGAQHLFDIDDT